MLESLRNDTSGTNTHDSVHSSVHYENSKDSEKVFNADIDAFLAELRERKIHFV